MAELYLLHLQRSLVFAEAPKEAHLKDPASLGEAVWVGDRLLQTREEEAAEVQAGPPDPERAASGELNRIHFLPWQVEVGDTIDLAYRIAGLPGPSGEAEEALTGR